MRFASLGSGSEGNALIVEAGRTKVMVDCGFGIAETEARLARLRLAPDDLNGILLTHEHGDHAGGVAKFAAKHDLPVWLTYGSLLSIEEDVDLTGRLNEIDGHDSVNIGDLHIQPYSVPHDAREPVQFVFSDGARRLGLLTDAGHVTPHITTRLSGCHALVLECNHDAGMLARGPYPAGLKQRVAGKYGHLDNDAAAALLARIDRSVLQHLVAAHLSRQNNTETHAREALAQPLGCSPDWIHIARQDEGLDWLSLQTYP
jgi:phosphoribosyl 1,2-cyclic phosphodiesterase